MISYRSEDGSVVCDVDQDDLPVGDAFRSLIERLDECDAPSSFVHDVAMAYYSRGRVQEFVEVLKQHYNGLVLDEADRERTEQLLNAHYVQVGKEPAELCDLLKGASFVLGGQYDDAAACFRRVRYKTGLAICELLKYKRGRLLDSLPFAMRYVLDKNFRIRNTVAIDEFLEKMLPIEKDSPDFFRNIDVRYTIAGENLKSPGVLRLAESLPDEDVRTNYIKARILHERGDFENALIFYSKCNSIAALYNSLRIAASVAFRRGKKFYKDVEIFRIKHFAIGNKRVIEIIKRIANSVDQFLNCCSDSDKVADLMNFFVDEMWPGSERGKWKECGDVANVVKAREDPSFDSIRRIVASNFVEKERALNNLACFMWREIVRYGVADKKFAPKTGQGGRRDYNNVMDVFDPSSERYMKLDGHGFIPVMKGKMISPADIRSLREITRNQTCSVEQIDAQRATVMNILRHAVDECFKGCSDGRVQVKWGESPESILDSIGLLEKSKSIEKEKLDTAKFIAINMKIIRDASRASIGSPKSSLESGGVYHTSIADSVADYESYVAGRRSFEKCNPLIDGMIQMDEKLYSSAISKFMASESVFAINGVAAAIIMEERSKLSSGKEMNMERLKIVETTLRRLVYEIPAAAVNLANLYILAGNLESAMKWLDSWPECDYTMKIIPKILKVLSERQNSKYEFDKYRI